MRSGRRVAHHNGSIVLLGLLVLGGCSSSPAMDTGPITQDGGLTAGTLGGPCRSAAPECDTGLSCDNAVCVRSDASAPDGGDDAGVDAGTPDTGPVDSGEPELCAMTSSTSSVAGTCSDARDCTLMVTAPINCEACPDYTRALCSEGACESTAQIETGDIHTLTFSVPSSLQPSIDSFAGIVVHTKYASGVAIDCDDVDQGRVDIENPCLNVLDSRGVNVGRVAATFVMSFSRFLSEQSVLFVVYAYGNDGASGPPIGLSCTPFTVGLPGTGPVEVSGDPMRSL